MAHEVIRTVKGRQYRYLEETVRTERGPRKRSIYLGALAPIAAVFDGLAALNDFAKANFKPEPGDYAMRQWEKEQERKAAEEKAAKPEEPQEKAPPSDGEADDGGEDPTPSSEPT